MRAGGLERDREQLEADLAAGFTAIVANQASGATTDEAAQHLGRVIAGAYVSYLESVVKGVFSNIARDVLLAPLLALGALTLLVLSDYDALDWTIVTGLLLGTAWIVSKGAYWADWAPFLAPRERLPFAEITNACGSVSVLTASFAGLSYVLAGEGALAVAPAGQALSVWRRSGSSSGTCWTRFHCSKSRRRLTGNSPPGSPITLVGASCCFTSSL